MAPKARASRPICWPAASARSPPRRRCAPWAATGRTRPRSSVTCAAPCRSPIRSRIRPTGSRRAADACADDRGDAAHLARDALAFPGVRCGADLEIERAQTVPRRQRATHGTPRTVKGRIEAVAGGVLLHAPMPRELLAHERVVALDQLAPAAISDLG